MQFYVSFPMEQVNHTQTADNQTLYLVLKMYLTWVGVFMHVSLYIIFMKYSLSTERGIQLPKPRVTDDYEYCVYAVKGILAL